MGLEVLEELMQPAPVRKKPVSDRVPSFLEIGYGYRPGRSSGFSVILHLTVLLLIVISSTHFVFVQAAEVVRPKLEPMKVDPLYLPELFPTRVRATGQGLCYNFGRILAAVGALTQGQLVNAYAGSYAKAGATVTLIYLVGMALIWLAPETKDRPLPD